MKQISHADYARRFFDSAPPAGSDLSLFLAEAGDFRLPRRKETAHKYQFGRALLVGGSTGFSGAPVLAANACERSGAGLTHLMVPDCIYPIAATRCDGAVVTPLPSGPDGCFSADAAAGLIPRLQRANACVLGPGLGTVSGSLALLEAVLWEADCPLVLDADALTLCGRYPSLLSECRVPVILTPHEGEFRRLGGDLSSGRLAGALAFSDAHPDVILILKGFGTLICRNRETFVNPTGSPAMAKGGSGDVLCGILCALLAQGFDPLFSARCAVYLHGLAGDLAAEEFGEYSVTPSDLIRALPTAIRSVCEGPV